MGKSGLEFGLDTFGDVTVQSDGKSTPQARVIREVVDEAVLADAVGIDFFGIGEHHRADFAVSSPEMVLGAIAGRTERIRLGSAVTVLSSDDPIRVFQRFSTLNAVSGGRAEVIVGRGSFTESFPLFGLPPLVNATVFPRPEGRLATWVGVGGSPQSIVRAPHYGLPVMLAIIGGDPIRFQPYAELFTRALTELGKAPQPIGVHSPGHIAATDDEARERFWPHYKVMHDRIGAQRGWPPLAREAFDQEVAAGSLYLGSAETVARKITRTVKLLKPSRFQLKYSAGTLPHAVMLDSIERYGRDVVPMVRDMLSGKAPVMAEA
jgi:alkanesulfonate monooxygenase SsuD/methylene tetrahydromethanopterin reductase-like flavin-dependent oxidoreductase (luciferase family)